MNATPTTLPVPPTLSDAHATHHILARAVEYLGVLTGLIDAEAEAAEGVVEDDTLHLWDDALGTALAQLDIAQATRERVEAHAAALREKAAAIADRARRYDAVAEALKLRIRAAVEAQGGKAQAGVYALRVSPGRERIDIDEAAPIAEWPEGLVRITVAPDKAAALRALKGGAELSGARVVRGEPILAVRVTG